MALGSRIGSQGVDALINGQESWNSPDVVAAIQQWKDWNDAGLLGKSPTSQTTDGAAALFYSGDAAVLPTGSWAIPAIDKNAKFDVGYMPFPAESGPGVYTDMVYATAPRGAVAGQRRKKRTPAKKKTPAKRARRSA